jgi:hypothetical protein
VTGSDALGLAIEGRGDCFIERDELGRADWGRVGEGRPIVRRKDLVHTSRLTWYAQEHH